MSLRHRLLATQWVPYPVPQVFAFFANPANLPPLMPAWQAPRIEEQTIVPPPPSPVGGQPQTPAAGQGSRILLSFLPVPFAPIRLHWLAEITEFSWEERFCDYQVTGPFGYWLHCHSLQPGTRNGQPGTVITDDVRYSMKLGPLGEAAHVLGGAWAVRLIFAYRHRMTPILLRQAS